MRTEKSLVGDPYFPAVHVKVHAVVLLAALENFPASQFLQAVLSFTSEYFPATQATQVVSDVNVPSSVFPEPATQFWWLAHAFAPTFRPEFTALYFPTAQSSQVYVQAVVEGLQPAGEPVTVLPTQEGKGQGMGMGKSGYVLGN